MKRKSLPKHFQNSKQDADDQAILWLALTVGICHYPQKEQIISLKPTSRGATNTQQWISLVGTKLHLAWNDIVNSRQHQTFRNDEFGFPQSHHPYSHQSAPHRVKLWHMCRPVTASLLSWLSNPFLKQPVLLLCTSLSNKLEQQKLEYHSTMLCILQWQGGGPAWFLMRALPSQLPVSYKKSRRVLDVLCSLSKAQFRTTLCSLTQTTNIQKK